MPQSIGEQLKNAREARKLTLEQVFHAIRINVRYLQALENDRRDALPSPVQGKGFLRLYAGYLDLPVNELVDAWEGKLPPPPEPLEVPSLPAVDTTPLPGAGEAGLREPDAGDSSLQDENASIEIQYIGAEEPVPPPPVVVEAPLPESQKIFNEIGSQLRQRRESLGLTVPDVERFTKLRQHYLTALEEGRMKDLPSFVQGRGMLSNYAGFLELDTDAILLRFAEALQQRRLENMPPSPQSGFLNRKSAASRQPTQPPTAAAQPTGPAANSRSSRPSLLRFATPDLVIGGMVIFILIAVVIWAAAQVSATRRQANEPTPPPIANVLAGSPTAPLPTGEATEQPAITVPPNAEVGNLPSGSDSVESTPTALPVIGDAPLQVYIVAKQRAWLKVVEDGKVKFNGRVVPGNVYSFSGEEQVELTTGNAAALQVFYNQRDLGALGVFGQVAALIFNSEGVLTPTPSFSPTPTQTGIPTVTPQPSPTLATPTVTPFIP